MDPIFRTIARVLYCVAIALLSSVLTSSAKAANPVPTTATQLTAIPATVAAGARLTLVATVKDGAGEPVPNGSVTFYDGGKALGTVQVVRTTSGGGTIGTATYKTFFLPLGANVITATYIGAGAGSTSSPQTVTVTGKYPSATVLSASGTQGNYSLTGQVSGSGPGVPTGQVTFHDALVSSPLGSATLDAKTLVRNFNPTDIGCPGLTSGASQLSVADLNSDGIPDLLALSTGYRTTSNGTDGVWFVVALLSNGDGTFRCGPSTDIDSDVNEPPATFVAGDFNGDGRVDAIFVEASSFNVFLGNGDGSFKAAGSFAKRYTQIATYDMNGDGILDVVGYSLFDLTLDVVLGNSDGTFQTPITTFTSDYNAFTIGDINGDGRPDVVIPGQNYNSLDTFLGNGDGTFQAPRSSALTTFFAANAQAVDLNGDGKLDLVLGGSASDYGSAAGVVLGKGDGTFGDASVIYEFPGIAVDFAEYPIVGDLNGDGVPDVIAPTSFYPDIESSEVYLANILYGRGDGTFLPAISYPLSSIRNPILIADVNGDGRQDIINLSGTTADVGTVFLNQVTVAATITGVTLPGVKTDKVTAQYVGDGSFALSTSNTLVLASNAAPSAPVFDLAAGEYGYTQRLTISEPTPGVVVYYTTDGTTPSTSSIRLHGPIDIYTSETVKAVAIAYGVSSALTSAAYVIDSPPPCMSIDYSKGFTANGMVLNGSAKVTKGLLKLTDGRGFQAGSAYFATPVPATNFVTDFTFQLLNPEADGITFVIQAAGPHALGRNGGGLGYAGIPRSIAVKFDLYNNSGEGPNSSGTYRNGAYPSQPSISLNGTKIDLHSGHTLRLHVAYDGKVAMATLTDTVTNVVLVAEFPGSIPEVLGSASAYFGFTGGTGSLSAIQQISAWSYAGGTGCQMK